MSNNKETGPDWKRQAKPREQTTSETGARIMEAAERLCGELGLEAVSVRDIAAEAAVNLSAINYHFGTRVNLLLAILRARGRELERERDALLAEVMLKDPPDLREVLRALLTPLARWRTPGQGRRSALQFLCRALTTAEPELKEQIDAGVLGFRRFAELLHRAVPHLTMEEVYWRLHFTMSIEHMNYWDVERLKLLSNGSCRAERLDESLERAIDFAAAGFLAPSRDFGPSARTTTHTRPARSVTQKATKSAR
jgi:AcrR family transcriptional regulator